MKRRKPHPLDKFVGEMVSFWEEGWRYGRLVSISGQFARVRHPVTGMQRVALDVIRPVDKQGRTITHAEL